VTIAPPNCKTYPRPSSAPRVESGSRSFLLKAAALLILPVALWTLTGCQGFSSGGQSGGNSQSGTLALSSNSLDFGSVVTDGSKLVAITATNSGAASLTISGATFSTKYFSLTSPTLPVTIAAGKSAQLGITFTPDATGSFTATLTIASDASNSSVNVTLTGSGTTTAPTPAELTVNPLALSVGTVDVGSSGSAAGSLSASGGSVTVSAGSTDNSAFTLSGIAFPVTIASGQSLPFSVTFTPQASGAASSTLTFTSDAQPATITESLTGTGTGSTSVGQLSASPATIAIGNVAVGSSGNGSGTLTASGNSVTVTGAASNNSSFTLSGISLPLTIAAGQSVPFTVTFSPLVTGPSSATFTFTSNAQPTTTTDAATGNGTTAASHSVNLSWNASSSGNISGYNVYRAGYSGSCGSFGKINAQLNTGLLYTDSAVANGSSYCYATTAVNTSNQESGYSNIVSNVQIPSQ